jgi:hypothetical protein
MVPAECLADAVELIRQLDGLTVAREGDRPPRDPRRLRGLLGLIVSTCLVSGRGK